MDERELERKLKAMPLRRPERLPGELSDLLAQEPPASLRGVPATPFGAEPAPREDSGTLRRLLTWRISLWQAAAAAAILLALQAGIAQLRMKPPEVVIRSVPTMVPVSISQPPEAVAMAELARLPTAARRDFWTLPPSARRQGQPGAQLILYDRGNQ